MDRLLNILHVFEGFFACTYNCDPCEPEHSCNGLRPENSGAIVQIVQKTSVGALMFSYAAASP